MVNRYLFLTGFMIFAILSNSIGFSHLSVSAVQESMFLDHHASDLVQPGDDLDSGKNKAIFYESHVVIVFLIICIAIAGNRNTALFRRARLLTPVFYQSNYVGRSLLNQSIN